MMVQLMSAPTSEALLLELPQRTVAKESVAALKWVASQITKDSDQLPPVPVGTAQQTLRYLAVQDVAVIHPIRPVPRSIAARVPPQILPWTPSCRNPWLSFGGQRFRATRPRCARPTQPETRQVESALQPKARRHVPLVRSDSREQVTPFTSFAQVPKSGAIASVPESGRRVGGERITYGGAGPSRMQGVRTRHFSREHFPTVPV